MRSFSKFVLLAAVLCSTISYSACNKKKGASALVISDVKEFKKLLQSKNNVLTLFVVNKANSVTMVDIFKEVAAATKGRATIVIVECYSKESKKLCKTHKIGEDDDYYIKHFKDGKFHKDYDRRKNYKSIITFLNNPTGDLPWDEDESAVDVAHVPNQTELLKLLKKTPNGVRKILVVFYAPWCGFCKKMKPDYVKAAKELKNEAVLAAIDVAKQENFYVRERYNITGFPTLLYFEDGILKFPYNGPNTHQDIVNFVRDPQSAPKPEKTAPPEESWSPDSDIVHLSDDDFDDTIAKHKHVLVAFYAPWCGHCKRIKPEFEKAAATLKKQSIEGILAAVDATKNGALVKRFDISGYPTIKFFENGAFAYDTADLREEKKIVQFMKKPEKPAPPPEPEDAWSTEDSPVKFLTVDNFKTTLKRVQHALVMFYAPWCGHCKKAKPHFEKAARGYDLELRVMYAAVDCTNENSLCKTYDVTGFPTFKYFSHFDKIVSDYDGGRTEKDFVNFMSQKLPISSSADQIPKNDHGFSSDVKLVDDKTYQPAIESSTPTFVLYFSAWCAICKEIKPNFNKVAAELKGSVNFVACDVGTHLDVADMAGILSIPKIKMFSRGKLLADYLGDRSTSDMLQFVKKHMLKEKTEL